MIPLWLQRPQLAADGRTMPFGPHALRAEARDPLSHDNGSAPHHVPFASSAIAWVNDVRGVQFASTDPSALVHADAVRERARRSVPLPEVTVIGSIASTPGKKKVCCARKPAMPVIDARTPHARREILDAGSVEIRSFPPTYRRGHDERRERVGADARADTIWRSNATGPPPTHNGTQTRRTDRWRAARPMRSKCPVMASGQAGAQGGTSRCNDR